MKTILLKKDKEFAYYVSSLTKEQYELIKEHHYSKSLSDLEPIININFRGLCLIGKVEERLDYISPKIKEYLETFYANTSGSKQLHYRDYTKSIQEHKNKAWLINLAPDFKVSWHTLRISLNYPKFCVIWKATHDKIYEDVREF